MIKRHSPSVAFRKLLLCDIAETKSSWQPVIRNNWLIKFSIYRGNILLFIVSTLTSQSFVRHFNNEDAACDFINEIIEKDASKKYESANTQLPQ